MNELATSEKIRAGVRRRQVVALLGILASTMVVLSMVSYSSADQASGELAFTDLWKVFTNDAAIVAKAGATRNWLGLAGAVASNWFINGTIGYASIVLPVIALLWSIQLLARKNGQRLLVFTNYSLILAFLFATFSGTLKQFDDAVPLEWSGVVGHFIATVLSRLVGLTGAVLVVFGAFVLVLTLMVDLDYRATLHRLLGIMRSTGRVILSSEAYIKKLSSLRIFSRRRESPVNAVHVRKAAAEIPAAEVRWPEQTDRATRPLPLKKEASEPPPAEPAANEELQLDINESLKEEEVDFDGRSHPAERVADEDIDYVPPSVDLLDPVRSAEDIDENELKANAELLRTKLADFGVAIQSVSVTPGPVVTLYELVPATGVKISRIESLQDDIALALKARGIRIIAPIPGKGTVGVEIPNHNPALVTIRSIINSAKFRDTHAALPLALGKTIAGEVFVDDLTRMPHLLIAGATGSGKSVGINTVIASLLYRMHPSDVKFAIIDPKKIELSLYTNLRHHYLAVCPDIDEEIATAPANAVLLLKSVELEMERRYDRLAAAGVRNIADYNERLKSGRLRETEHVVHRKIPYLIVIVDELADLMITAAREVEEPIARLAQLARAVGIHLVLATQRPSVDVITGVIKANFPARIAYQVSSKIDSRTILDMNGAEQLLGNGDMLYMPPGSPKPIRIQNAFISTEEVERLTQHIGKQTGYSTPAALPSALERKRSSETGGDGERDELFEEAARIIVRHQQGSVSLLQRRLKVGYSRAARLVDELEGAGIVGPFDGSKAREVRVESESDLETILKNLV